MTCDVCVGKGGSRIREMESTSGARIKVPSHLHTLTHLLLYESTSLHRLPLTPSHLPHYQVKRGGGAQTEVLISGDPSSCKTAQRLVDETLSSGSGGRNFSGGFGERG